MSVLPDRCTSSAGALLLAVGKTALQIWCTDNLAVVATVEMAHTYLTVRALGAPLNSCLLVLQASCRGMGNAGLSLRAAVVANIVNLAMDPLLIFGLSFGVRGAAMATVTGQVHLSPLSHVLKAGLLKLFNCSKKLRKVVSILGVVYTGYVCLRENRNDPS